MSNILIPPISTPQRLKMSYEEYLNVASETHITEWVDGEVIIHMPPIYDHQYLAGFFQALLFAFILDFDLGELVVAPFEVKLWPEGPSREPDLAFIHHSNQTQLKRKSKRFDGAPDLIVEIVSPSSVRDDRVDKFMEYEQAGVKEYWIIYPNEQTLFQFVLNEQGKYQLHKMFAEDDLVPSYLFPDLIVDLKEAFED